MSYLLNKENQFENIFNVDDVRLNQDQESKQQYKEHIELSEHEPEKKIVLFNSNLNKRIEIISLRINTPFVEVYDNNGQIVENIQVSLIWPNTDGGYLREDLSDEKISNLDDLSFGFDFDESKFEKSYEEE